MLASKTNPPATGPVGALLRSGALTALPPHVNVAGGAGGAMAASFGSDLVLVVVADESAPFKEVALDVDGAGMLQGITFGSSGADAGAGAGAMDAADFLTVASGSPFPLTSDGLPPADS